MKYFTNLFVVLLICSVITGCFADYAPLLGWSGGLLRYAPCRLRRGEPRGVSFTTTSRHEKSTPKGAKFVVGGGGFEPPKSETSDLQSDAFGHSANRPYIKF